jgi:hypothetical protein
MTRSPLSAQKLALLERISDPKERRAQRDQMVAHKQALLSTARENLAQTREEMLRAIRQNPRA